MLCVCAVPAPDGTSHEITVVAGDTDSDQTDSSDDDDDDMTRDSFAVVRASHCIL